MTLVTVSGNKNTDDAIMEYAEKNNAYVYTNDRKLKSRLKQKKIKIIPPDVFIRKAGK